MHKNITLLSINSSILFLHPFIQLLRRTPASYRPTKDYLCHNPAHSFLTFSLTNQEAFIHIGMKQPVVCSAEQQLCVSPCWLQNSTSALKPRKWICKKGQLTIWFYSCQFLERELTMLKDLIVEKALKSPLHRGHVSRYCAGAQEYLIVF